MGAGGTRLGYVLLAVPVLAWGLSSWMTEIAGGHIGALLMAGMRTLPSVLPLLALVLLGHARFPRGRVALWSAVTGLLMVTVFYAGFIEGTVRAGTGIAAVLSNTAPFFVLALSRIYLRERIPPSRAAGLVVGFAGIVVMVWSRIDVGDTGQVLLGMALALAAGAGWGVGTLIVKWVAECEDDLELVGFTAGQLLFGGSILLVLGLTVNGWGSADWSSGALWGPLAYLVVVATVLATLAFFAALKRLPATVTSSSQFLIPVVAVAIDIGRGEVPDADVFAGMALAVVGVALVTAAPERLVLRRARARVADARGRRPRAGGRAPRS